MPSEIYEACRHGDTDLVQVLIQSSPDNADISRLEPNGSTALHVACSHGFIDIVRLLLNDSRVDRHRTNEDGRSAYEVASSEEIRRLFHRPPAQTNPFCTAEELPSLFTVINREDSTNPRYIDAYPSAAPISTDLHSKVLGCYFNRWPDLVDGIKILFGQDPDQKKFDNWLKDLQCHLERCLIDEYLEKNLEPNYSIYSKAYQCIKAFEKTREVGHLLKLYTLDTSICQYFAKNLERTNYLHAPISFALDHLAERAYRGTCFRGLKMKTREFEKYQHAFFHEKNYIRLNTFCSTSTDPSVAQMFADSGQTNESINVIMCFSIDQKCPTILQLFACPPRLKCLSYYEDEQEVLILPGTVFSIIMIEENAQMQSTFIHLEHYNTDEEEKEMHQDRMNSYIDTFFTD